MWSTWPTFYPWNWRCDQVTTLQDSLPEGSDHCAQGSEAHAATEGRLAHFQRQRGWSKGLDVALKLMNIGEEGKALENELISMRVSFRKGFLMCVMTSLQPSLYTTTRLVTVVSLRDVGESLGNLSSIAWSFMDCHHATVKHPNWPTIWWCFDDVVLVFVSDSFNLIYWLQPKQTSLLWSLFLITFSDPVRAPVKLLCGSTSFGLAMIWRKICSKPGTQWWTATKSWRLDKATKREEKVEDSRWSWIVYHKTI